MEYLNINSLAKEFKTPPEIRNILFEKYDQMVPKDIVITTNELELIRGEELIEDAIKNKIKIVPLKRASYIKDTDGFPKRILLELTNKCNSYCSVCPRNASNRDEIHMETELAKNLISQFAEVGISGLWLYCIGESLLHPDFFDILKYCRQYDNLGPIWLSTNGELMDANLRKTILENPVDILNYSVNSMSEEGYKEISPNLNFHKIHENLTELIKLKKDQNKTKPIIRAQMIEIPHVLNEIEYFKKEYGNKADILSFNKLEIFSQNLESEELEKEKVFNKKIKKCNRLDRVDFFILSNGVVTCCDTDFNGDLNLGNVNEHSIKEIFEGDKYQDLLKQYKEGRLNERPLCAKCKDFDL